MRLLVVFLFFVVTARAQQSHFYRHFTEKDGLSSNQVNCIFRDKQGFLWVGTNYGLNRFDGKNFRQYLPAAQQAGRTVNNEFINAIDQDSDGFIWIATRKGLHRYDPLTGAFKLWENTGRNDGSLPNSLVNHIFMDGQYVWLACDNRDLCCMDTRTGVFTTYPWKAFAAKSNPSKADLNYKTIFTLSRKNDAQIWLHTNLGVYSFDKNTRQFTDYPIFPTGLKVAKSSDCADDAYFGSSFYNNYTAPSGALAAFYREENGTIWLGGENGLWQLDPQLQHFNGCTMTPDPAQGAPNRFGRILDIPELNRRLITDIQEKQLWVYERGKLLRTISLHGQPGILFQDRSGQIWVSGGRNIYRLNPKNLALTPFPIPKNLPAPEDKSFFPEMAEDAAGNFWFANNKDGVYIYKKGSGIWYKPGEADGFIAQGTTSILADTAQKTVWIGTEDYGLFRYDEVQKQFTLYRYEENAPTTSLGAYIVLGLCRDKNGYIWAATDPGGISRFDYNAPSDRAFLTLNTNNGLPSNQAMSLVSDKAGNVWVGTTKGLAYVDAQTLRVRSWNRNSGLKNDFIDLALSLGAQGAVLWGGKSGYEFVFPDSILAEKDDHRILLTSLKVFDREISEDSSIAQSRKMTLHWEERFFSVEFASANFSRPELTQYAVRLTGFDQDWKMCGNEGRSSWTNVPPGTYKMEVKTIREGKETAVQTLLLVTILPPFWQTWWFIGLVILSIIGAIWGIYRYRIAQITQQEQLKTEFNKRIAQVEMTALRAQMNPHFVFNCLNSINRFILVNEPDAASAYLTKFSRLIRHILDNSRQETVPLDKEMEALRLYIEMEMMRFDGHFTYEIKTDTALQTELIEVPPLLIQPFVENAIWHGLMHKKEQGLLSIQVNPIANGIGIAIEDNGIGRQKAMDMKSKSATTHKSHGIELTAERLNIIESLYGVKTEVTIDDLHDDKGHPNGTRVTILYMNYDSISD